MKRDDATQLADDALKQLAEQLKQGHSEQLTKYLDVMARFHRYSWGNIILISVQRPEASHVAGFHAWKKLGRSVRKGEKGIAILAPMVRRKKKDDEDEPNDTDESKQRPKSVFGFKVAHVFDVAQTDGKELPEFATVNGDPGQYIERMKQIIQDADIKLTYERIPGGAFGESSGGAIRIRPDLEPAVEMSVLVHECAHEQLHKGERRSETTTKIRETEAEAVAYVVCRSIGLETNSASSDYIQLYRGTTETLAESLDVIQKTATDIITALQDKS